MAQPPVATPPADSGSLLDDLGTVFRRALRLWWLTAVVLVAAAAAGWYAGQYFRKETWLATGRLEYKPPAVAPDSRDFFTPSDLTTLSQQLKSRDLLREVGHEFHLANPVPTLDLAVTVSRPRDSNLLEVAI